MSGDLSKGGSDAANGYAEKIESRVDVQRGAPAAAPYGFRHKVKRHLRRFWWLHLILFCAGFLIISLCLVYVAMPRIAQSGVNDSSLSFYSLQFLNPTPDTVTLTQLANLHSPSMYTPTLDPFTAGLWLVTNGTFGPTPFTNIDLPSIHAEHQTNVSTVGQVLNILDEDQLAEYATQVLTQENVTTALTGRTKLHEGALPVIFVNYNSSSTYTTLNGLKGFNTTDVKLNLSAPAGQPNLLGNAFIPNPSVMTIQMGNVTLILSTASQGVVGNATINDFTLVPGDNNIPMTAIIDEILVLKSMNATTGIVDLEIVGNSSVYNGQHLAYYEKALSSNKLTLAMNVTQILADSS